MQLCVSVRNGSRFRKAGARLEEEEAFLLNLLAVMSVTAVRAAGAPRARPAAPARIKRGADLPCPDLARCDRGDPALGP